MRLALPPIVVLLLSAGVAISEEFPTRYWPEFRQPEKIVISESHNQISFPEGLLLNSLSGLVARACSAGKTNEMVWISLSNGPSYDEWQARFLKYTGAAKVEGAMKVWDLVERYKPLLKGYVLCRADTAQRPLYEGKPASTSVNVATALSSVLEGVVIEESLEEQAKAHGLELLLDARDKDEQWLWDNYDARFSRGVLGRQDPKSFVNRDAIVAMQAMVAGRVDDVYERALSVLRPGSPMLGWGIGLEDAQTGPCSRHACFQTATNWCVNLPLLSSGKTGMDYPVQPFPKPADAALTPDDNTRYVSFILSDGDNVQWLMLNFCKGEEAAQFWACPDRGKMPFGWTIPAADLLQLCPYTLDYLRETATSHDNFVLLGGGYYYPDWFGQEYDNPREMLAAQARRTALYMSKCGLTTLLVNVQDWDSKEAVAAYETYADEIPALDALFVIQYAPYTGGAGEIRWMNRKMGRSLPVISCRNALWCGRGSDPREGTPSRVAKMLNEWAARPITKPEDRFAWVIIHAWSWFKQGNAPADEEVDQNAPVQPGVARGYRPALWCTERLDSRIKLVTPTTLATMLNHAR